jgi:hypothetical protein
VAVAQNLGLSGNVVVGVEAEADTNWPAGEFLNPNAFSASFVASAGGNHMSTQHVDAYFLANPNNPAANIAVHGFYCPAGNVPGGGAPSVVTDACFSNDSPVDSLDSHRSPAGTGQIWLPNNASLLFSDTSGFRRKAIGMSATNDVAVGYDEALASIRIGSPLGTVPIELNSLNLGITQFHTPTSSSEACTTGKISVDADYIYLCVARNTWKRSALSSF